MWGTKGGRAKLGQKLVEGWRWREATMVRIGKAKDEVESIFCNRAHKNMLHFFEITLKNVL